MRTIPKPTSSTKSVRWGRWLGALGVLSLASLVVAQISWGKISSTAKYAWAENLGWSNWADANSGTQGVEVRSTHLRGWIWLENAGWIRLNSGAPLNGSTFMNRDSSDYGVNISPKDELYGYGWSENLGWLNFDTRSKGTQRARFDRATYRLRGFVWSENAGWINLESGPGGLQVVPTPRASGAP
ncbi:MAG TPA: hypothetical protein PLO61_06350 [Fimbriimonadaceae bacterium]|nr:hypothetical protein [Fimbriimonadaceae bacterium]HRJ33128.1 hypothetical protein [Fimbriimonadaceae bacterium]